MDRAVDWEERAKQQARLRAQKWRKNPQEKEKKSQCKKRHQSMSETRSLIDQSPIALMTCSLSTCQNLAAC